MMMGQETDEELLLDGEFEAYDGIMRNNVVLHTDRACAAVSSAQNIKVLNNTCYDTGRVQHGSLFFSNESIVGQASDTVEVANNIVYGSANLPLVKMTAKAFDDFTTLSIHDNLYWTVDGAPKFHPNAEFSPVSAANWYVEYEELTGHADNSRVLDPKFETFIGNTPLTLAADSPAINTGFNTSSVTKDFKWVARPQGPKHEIGAYEFTRTALVDTVSPIVFTASPGPGATFVAVGASVSANFSEAIDCATVTTGTFGLSGAA